MWPDAIHSTVYGLALAVSNARCVSLINRGCVSDLLPDMLKPAFPAKSDLPPTIWGGSVAKNKGRLPKITFGVSSFFFSFAAKSLICCQKLDLLQVSAYLTANH